MNPIESLAELKANGFWYLMSPYRKYQGGNLHRAYMDVLEISELLKHAGVKHYSPIVASHEWAFISGVSPIDNAFWLRINWPWMGASVGGLIVSLEGWEQSDGIKEEQRWFLNHKKPVKLIAPSLLVPEEIPAA